MGAFLKLFPLLSRDSPLILQHKLLLYNLVLRAMITYAAPVWSSTSPPNLHHLQVFQSKCLRVIGDLPRKTPIPTLHTLLHSVPIKSFIYKLTDCFFTCCSNHPNPLIRHIGNYSLADLLHQYPKYRHKQTKHILL